MTNSVKEGYFFKKNLSDQSFHVHGLLFVNKLIHPEAAALLRREGMTRREFIQSTIRSLSNYYTQSQIKFCKLTNAHAYITYINPAT